MAITVSRPKLNWSERLYLPAILSGMAITIKHFKNMLFGRTKVTMQYPEEKWDSQMPEHYRGAPALVRDDTGRVRCVACQLCEFICPPRAIKIIPGEIPAGDRFAKVEKFPQRIRYRHDPLHLLRLVRGGLSRAGDLPAKRLRHHRLHPRGHGAQQGEAARNRRRHARRRLEMEREEMRAISDFRFQISDCVAAVRFQSAICNLQSAIP